MKNYITHDSFVELYNKDDTIFDRIFGKTKTISTLINKFKKESLEWEKYGYSEKDGKDKMIGDLFEIFAEVFFKILGASNNIGVYDYQIEIDDYGVDGFGKGIDDKPCAIQVKFRSDINTELTQEDLNQFGYQAIVKHGVDKDTNTNLIVLTTAGGMHWLTDSKVFLGKIRTINREQLRTLVDGNFPFWNTVRDYVENTVDVVA